MATCLVALGSNVGDRAATLESAVESLRNESKVRVARSSRAYCTDPVGGAALAGEFVNAAVLIETSREPNDLLEVLARIESQHGRERRERWANRPLDLDLLLYGDRVVESPQLTLPHPRMSFRRFALEPAAEIAPDFIHPQIGWNLGHLLRHLDAGADCVAILAPDDSDRREVTELLADRFGARTKKSPDGSGFAAWWPSAIASWEFLAAAKTEHSQIRTTDTHPKLTIRVDPPNQHGTAWSAIARQPGRGPTLHITAPLRRGLAVEVSAAVKAVWPRLGPSRP
jgi:2-amino-4-hydroxy-6-hydroxymethyldihydropteridine diphosphokinase